MQGLKKMRKERGLKAVELSKAVGVKQSTVSMWESDKRFPRKDTLKKLCEFFDCKVDDLM